MEQVTPYGHAIVSVVIVAAMAQLLNAATGIRKDRLGMQPGETYAADYGNPAYRLDRAYLSTLETTGFYAVLVFAAILAGANPLWTNVFAALGMAFRVVANLVYIRGVGKGYGGIRTNLLIGMSLCHLGLAVLTVMAVF